MTQKESRLVGYLSWVDDEDFEGRELEFMQRLIARPEIVLSPLESRFLSWIYGMRSY